MASQNPLSLVVTRLRLLNFIGTIDLSHISTRWFLRNDIIPILICSNANRIPARLRNGQVTPSQRLWRISYLIITDLITVSRQAYRTVTDVFFRTKLHGIYYHGCCPPQSHKFDRAILPVAFEREVNVY